MVFYNAIVSQMNKPKLASYLLLISSRS